MRQIIKYISRLVNRQVKVGELLLLILFHQTLWQCRFTLVGFRLNPSYNKSHYYNLNFITYNAANLPAEKQFLHESAN